MEKIVGAARHRVRLQRVSVAKREHEGTHAAGGKIRRNTNFPGSTYPFYHLDLHILLRGRIGRPIVHARIRIVASLSTCATDSSYIIVNLPASFLFATHASHLNTYTDIKCNDCRPFWPRGTVRLSVDNAL